MKKTVFVLGLVALFFVSCGEKKKDKDAAVANIKLGKKLFISKTCATCHLPDTKVIGPSIKSINKIYAEKNGNIVKFLKGEAEPIVDTDPAQVAIMKTNIEGFVKDLSGDEKAALAAYMRSIK